MSYTASFTAAVRALVVGLAALAASPVRAAEPPPVVATIKPIHSLVAGVMEGVGKPNLLVGGGQSPHTYSLRPSDMRTLEAARLVFWVGPAMETFLEKALGSLPSGARAVPLIDTDGLTLIAGEHGHDEDAGDHEHGDVDAHIWLSPDNAKTLVSGIARELASADPANAERYGANAATLSRKIDALDADLRRILEPIRTVPYVVFHDAFRYFENHYGLANAGAVTLSPERQPGARHVRAIHRLIEKKGAACVFAEPGFDPKLIRTVTAGTEARTGTLDPEGTGMAEGPELYFQLMRRNAEALRFCLSGGQD